MRQKKPYRIAAVDHGRVIQFSRNSHKELAHEKYVKGRRKPVRDDERAVRADPVKLDKEQICGDQSNVLGQNHGREHNDKHDISKRKSKARETETDHG